MNEQLDRWLNKNTSHTQDKAPRKFFSFKQKNTGPTQPPKPTSNPVAAQSTSKPHNSHNGGGGNHGKLKIIPIGGLNEVGQNMMVIEYGNDMIVIDMGFQFPEEDMLGVDYVLPDFTYIEKNRHKLRGVIITHGHLDHIGGVPYISPKLDNPNFYGTKLTMGLVQKRMEEFGLEKVSRLNVIDPSEFL